jgi:hypothetical protein
VAVTLYVAPAVIEAVQDTDAELDVIALTVRFVGGSTILVVAEDVAVLLPRLFVTSSV